MNKINIDKYTGCLIEETAEDASGYPVEFKSDVVINSIPEKEKLL